MNFPRHRWKLNASFFLSLHPPPHFFFFFFMESYNVSLKICSEDTL